RAFEIVPLSAEDVAALARRLSHRGEEGRSREDRVRWRRRLPHEGAPHNADRASFDGDDIERVVRAAKAAGGERAAHSLEWRVRAGLMALAESLAPLTEANIDLRYLGIVVRRLDG